MAHSPIPTLDLSRALTLRDVCTVARGEAVPVLGDEARAKVARSRAVVDAFLQQHDTPRYGINTGFGALAEVVIPVDQVEQLQVNLVRSHACGTGPRLPVPVVRAMTLLRAQVLARGHSGVRPAVIDALCGLLERGVHPVIPSQGSVGASGDLAPLAHLALVLIGEGEAEFQGGTTTGSDALRRAGLSPIRLQAKEGLSLINGTQQMTALGVLCHERALNLVRAADVAGALTAEASLGSVRAFDPRIQALRPHPGQSQTAHNLRALMADSPLVASHAGPECKKVQDPYSLRCMPQVHGAVRDTLHHLGRVLAVEIDSVTDNPLIFPNDADDGPLHGEILSGGNFHGQPVALACDFAKAALASLASMSERRIEQLVNPSLSSGLPAFLAPESGLHSGFMIAQVSAAALVSESKALCFPNAVDSIPSSANREDHVSMGPIAARRLCDVLDMAERVVGIELLCAAQAVDLRAPLRPGVGTSAAWDLVRSRVPVLQGDRVLHGDLDSAAGLVRSGELVRAVQARIGEDLL